MAKDDIQNIVEELKQASSAQLGVDLSAKQTLALWSFLRTLIEITQLNSFNEEEVNYLYALSPISRIPGSFNQ
jgi:transcriptional regulatory protein LevR